VEIGMDCLISPQASLVGCQLGEAVDVASQGMIFQGARIGDGCRLGVRVL
jgi:carbonic anhydrase/acetyltransferase-like protein (isoleucine patch superfamily)